VRRFVAAAVVVVALAVAAPAHAGTYDVIACDGAPGSANNSWSAYTSSSRMRSLVACPSNGAPERGIWVSNIPGAGQLAYGEQAWEQFWAPSGANVVGITFTGGFFRAGPSVSGSSDWAAQLVTSEGVHLRGCAAYQSALCRDVHTTGSSASFPPTVGISIVASCFTLTWCNGSVMPAWDSQFGNATAAVQLRSATVRVSDSSAPAASVSGGDLVAGGWVRGLRSLTYSASDNVGIRVARAYVDGVERASETLPCDYTRAAPCGPANARPLSIDTALLPDGERTLRVDAVDSAGNVGSSAPKVIQVDNHAPAAPAGVTVEPSSWSGTNRFDVRWTNPGGQGSPMAKAHWSLCAAEGAGTCTTGTAAGTNIDSLGGLSVPAAGAWSLNVWLEDAAGNSNAANASAPVTLRFDDAVPDAPRLAVPRGWVNAGDLSVGVSGGSAGASGLAGYSVTRDGSDPDATVDLANGESYSLRELVEGVTTVKARSVSRAGVAGATARAVVRVDRTAPTTKLLGAGDPLTPHPGPTTVTVSAADALSGMAAAEAGEPVTSGAYVAYTLDGGPETLVAGDEAQVPVASEGVHTLAYRAVDVAGNGAAGVERRIVIQGPLDGPHEHAFFWDLRTNPHTTFTAASRFGPPCPEAATATADRDASTAEHDPDAAAPAQPLRVDSTGPKRSYALLGFPLPAAPDCTVASATLRLTVLTTTPPTRVAVYRAAAAWSEESITWNTQPGTAGYAATVPDAEPGKWVDVDVTEQIRAIYRHGDNGLQMRAIDGALTFGSRESAALSDRPRLTVSFER
jgi:hypothetical protein